MKCLTEVPTVSVCDEWNVRVAAFIPNTRTIIIELKVQSLVIARTVALYIGNSFIALNIYYIIAKMSRLVILFFST